MTNIAIVNFGDRKAEREFDKFMDRIRDEGEVKEDMKLLSERSYKVWSAVMTDRDGYAQEVEVFNSKSAAKAFIRDEDGDWKLVNGTQLWNKSLGRIEEK